MIKKKDPEIQETSRNYEKKNLGEKSSNMRDSDPRIGEGMLYILSNIMTASEGRSYCHFKHPCMNISCSPSIIDFHSDLA